MGKSQLTGSQIKDGTITRDDINVTMAGKAVIAKIIDGNNGVKIDTNTGADTGTGDVSLKVDLTYLDTKYPSLLTPKSQNLFFASPAIGSGNPAFRSLTPGDIPALNYLPYTGATSNININTKNFETSGILTTGNMINNIASKTIAGTGIIDITMPNLNLMGVFYIDVFTYGALVGTFVCQFYTYYGNSINYAGANSVSFLGRSSNGLSVRYVTVGTDNNAERHIYIGDLTTNWGNWTEISIRGLINVNREAIKTNPPSINLINVEASPLNTSLTFTDFSVESALKLGYSRNINATPFNGQTNITTNLWGTARNFTVGNSTKSVNGSANMSWTLAEIGAAPTSHTHAFSEITNKPTTASGYGIGDVPRQGYVGGNINSVRVSDTRSTNPLPTTDLQFGAWFDFKNTSAIGLSGTGVGLYAGVITMVPYQDNSGNINAAFRISQSADELYFQNYSSAGNWGSHRKIWSTKHFSQIDINNWFAAFGWGNHANAGYVKQSDLNTQLGNYAILNGVQIFTSTNTFNENIIIPNATLAQHAVNLAQMSDYVDNNNSVIINYITSNYISTSHVVNAITSTDILNWNKAYGYGNHADAGYATETWSSSNFITIHSPQSVTAVKTFTVSPKVPSANYDDEAVPYGQARELSVDAVRTNFVTRTTNLAGNTTFDLSAYKSPMVTTIIIKGNPNGDLYIEGLDEGMTVNIKNTTPYNLIVRFDGSLATGIGPQTWIEVHRDSQGDLIKSDTQNTIIIT